MVEYGNALAVREPMSVPVVALHSQIRTVRNNLDCNRLIIGRASTMDLPDARAHCWLRGVVHCCSDR